MVIMTMETTTLYLYVETPLHAGVGSGLSSIDLPIQRERTTQYPMIQGSGIKGKLRSVAEEMAKRGQNPFDNRQEKLVDIIFGPENGNEHAGALIAGDARILLFPVRSLNGVFAYTTSYDVLNRFKRDMNRGGHTIDWKLSEKGLAEDTVHVTSKSQVAVNNKIVLEEFSFKVEAQPADAEGETAVDKIAKWLVENALPQTEVYAYWREKLSQSLVILPEEDFRDFVVNATEIITRIRIDRAKKTVDGGGLWTEEHLPSDTLLYVPVYATDARKWNPDRKAPEKTAKEVLKSATQLENGQQSYLQLGGDETVGRGMVYMHWGSSEKKENSNDSAKK
jgi:CRISPR-associated protein Cmr4